MRPKTQVLFSEHTHSGKLFCPVPTVAVERSMSSTAGNRPYRGTHADHMTIVISKAGLAARCRGLNMMMKVGWWWQGPLPKEYNLTKSSHYLINRKFAVPDAVITTPEYTGYREN